MASIKDLKKDVVRALGQLSSDCFIVDYVLGKDSDEVGDLYSETYTKAEEIYARIKAYPREKGAQGRKARREYFRGLEQEFQKLFNEQNERLIAIVEKDTAEGAER
ncbi:MAG: hypothetical protein CSA07_04815 [Bacteroidia bacterium]|nr:MAG: hypothetical protein CSA07_04815 [Bacteroidia bacterium]